MEYLKHILFFSYCFSSIFSYNVAMKTKTFKE